MTCKFRVYDRIKSDSIGSILGTTDYTCVQVRALKDELLKVFRDKNHSNKVKIDRAYENYKKEIEDFLTQCKCQESPIR